MSYTSTMQQTNFNPTTTPTYRGGNRNADYSGSSNNQSNYGYNANTYSNNSNYGGSSSNTERGQQDDKSKGLKSNIALQALNSNVLMWAGFFTVTMLLYCLVSGGDFSFLMTYGSLARLFGFGILNMKIFKGQRVTGVSIKTLQLYCVVFFFRLASTLVHEGYLPYDKSGDWLYHAVEGTSLLLASLALYASTVLFKTTYQPKLDSFGGDMGTIYMAGIILFLSIFVHPNLNQDFLSDTAWTFAFFLESAALAPQLYMFKQQSLPSSSSIIDLLMAHFVFALGFGRIMEFLFWIYSHHELEMSSGSKLPGYLALFSQIIQIIMMTNFLRGYFVAMKNSTPMKLPTNSLAVDMV